MRQEAVWIAPRAFDVPDGRMVDPESSVFSASWQWHDDAISEGGVIEDVDLVGAQHAVDWARHRAERVLIRLGQTGDAVFSASADPSEDLDDDGNPLPRWPPEGPPAVGWWSPTDP
jgi:hypothetical protein